MSSTPSSLWSSNPWLAGGITAASGIAGAMPQTSTTTGNFNNTTSGSSVSNAAQSLLNNINLGQTQQTTQQLSPEAQAFLDQLTQQYSNLANTGVDMSGYTGSGLANINSSFQGAQNNVDASLAARGLSTSPVAAAATSGIQAQRAGQQSQFLNSIPLLQNQLRLGNLGAAGEFFSQIPRNVLQTGTQTGYTSSTGNMSQDSSMNQTQSGSSTQKTTSGGGLAGLLGGIASTALGILTKSDKNIKENIADDLTGGDLAVKAVNKMKPKTFNFKGEDPSSRHVGFIAQDMEKILPHAVKNIGGIKHIDYGEVMPTLVRAIQHLSVLKSGGMSNSKTPRLA